jgi:hypothetical protein
VTLSRAARRARRIVLGLGAVYLVLGLAGFARAGWTEFGYEEPVRLVGVFGLSTLLNIVHVFVGVLAILAALGRAPSTFAVVALVAFTAMAVFGATAHVFGGAGDPLNLTWWNVVLFALSATACGYVYSLRLRAVRERSPDE